MFFLRQLTDILFPPRETEAIVRSIDATTLRLSPCLVHGEGETVTALMSYRDPRMHALIVEAKYYGNRSAWKILGVLLADYLLEFMSDAQAFSTKQFILVPIPLSPERRRTRGYNQAEEVAKIAREQVHDSVSVSPQALRRTRNTIPQTDLGGDARKKNMQGAFAATGTLHPSATYILIDDVVTTGATMHEAMTTLRKGGAHDIMAIALAH